MLELAFVEGVEEYFEDTDSRKWDDLDEPEMIKAIIDYTSTDEIAGLVYFDNEEDASNFKNSVIAEVQEIEDKTTFDHQIQDSEGYFRDVYKLK